ncbi:MAG TPA: hypothetical protein PKL31_08560 [Fulvivirga sp.]|nr:hypothetical protein [Fulvivirga sp.]
MDQVQMMFPFSSMTANQQDNLLLPTRKKEEVLVFRTDIQNVTAVALVVNQLKQIPGVLFATVDLEDWEKILRVECDQAVPADVIELVVLQMGYKCEELAE